MLLHSCRQAAEHNLIHWLVGRWVSANLWGAPCCSVVKQSKVIQPGLLIILTPLTTLSANCKISSVAFISSLIFLVGTLYFSVKETKFTEA